MRQQACGYFEQVYKDDVEEVEVEAEVQDTEDSGKVYCLSNEEDAPEFWGYYRGPLDDFADVGLRRRLIKYWERRISALQDQSDEDEQPDTDQESQSVENEEDAEPTAESDEDEAEVQSDEDKEDELKIQFGEDEEMIGVGARYFQGGTIYDSRMHKRQTEKLCHFVKFTMSVDRRSHTTLYFLVKSSCSLPTNTRVSQIMEQRNRLQLTDA